MTRGRGYSSSRGSSYRGSSSRGGSSWGGRGFSSSRGGGYSSSFNSYDSRSKYSSSSDRYSGSRGHSDDYRKSYRSVRNFLLNMLFLMSVLYKYNWRVHSVVVVLFKLNTKWLQCNLFKMDAAVY